MFTAIGLGVGIVAVLAGGRGFYFLLCPTLGFLIDWGQAMP